MNVLLTGATGFLGCYITATLLAHEHTVRQISRQRGVNFTDMLVANDWIPYLEGIDAVINCVGIIAETSTQRFEALHTQAPVALFSACKLAGVRRVIQVSAIGADQHAFSAYHRSKLAADQFLRRQDLDWLVLRPALIYGAGGSSTALLMRLARLPMIPVVGDGNQLLQPIYVEDFASIVLNALTFSNAKRTLDIVGPEKLTYLDWLQTLRQAQGLRAARVIHIPTRIVSAALHLGHYINPLLHADNLRMLKANYVADIGQTVELLGRLPQRVASPIFSSIST